jgi:hypothetical protein
MPLEAYFRQQAEQMVQRAERLVLRLDQEIFGIEANDQEEGGAPACSQRSSATGRLCSQGRARLSMPTVAGSNAKLELRFALSQVQL